MHTKGPWRWTNEYPDGNGDKTWSLLGEGGFGILSCDGTANSPQHIRPDDAPLIAAAPNMLEALELGKYEGDWATELYKFLLAEYAADPDSGDTVTADVRPHFDMLCEFIAKQGAAILKARQ